MGTSLTGLTPSTTYVSLLKTTDNIALSTTLKVVTDGAGNNSALELATDKVKLTNPQFTNGTYNVSSDELGYLDGVTSAIQTQLDSKTSKIITANRQTASYTLVAGDADKIVEMNVASANNLTVPASVFAAGNQILLAQYGAGQTTLVAGSGMTIRSNGGKLKLNVQYSGASLLFVSATEAYLFGDITT
jgi:hypothetical protein